MRMDSRERDALLSLVTVLEEDPRGPGAERGCGVLFSEWNHKYKATSGRSEYALRQSIAWFQEHTDSNPEREFVRIQGKGKGTRYSVPEDVAIASQIAQSSDEERGLCLALGVVRLTEVLTSTIDAGQQIPSFSSKPDDFVDLGEMVHPGFVTNQSLEITGASESFKRLFHVSAFPIEMESLFTRLHSYDLVRDKVDDSDSTLFSDIVAHLSNGKAINNDYYLYMPLNGGGDEGVIIEAFVTPQRRYVGTQGTLVVATNKVRRMQQRMFETAQFAHFILTHEVNSQLMRHSMALYQAQEDFARAHPDDSEHLRQLKLLMRDFDNIQLQLKEWQEEMTLSDLKHRESRADVESCVERAVTRVAGRYPDAQFAIDSDIPPHTVAYASMPALALVTVLEALLTNAYDASTESSAQGSQASISLTVDTEFPEYPILMVISNYGRGFPEEVVAAFRSGDEPPSTKHSGVGRGLAQSRRWLVEEYGHRMTIASTSVGASVTLRMKGSIQAQGDAI